MYKYRELGALGAGTYGTVMRCLDITNGRTVAVKRLHDTMTGLKSAHDRRHCEMMVREISLLQAFDDNHVVPMIEAFRHHGHIHMVFPMMRCNLYRYLELNGGALTVDATKECVYQVSILLCDFYY